MDSLNIFSEDKDDKFVYHSFIRSMLNISVYRVEQIRDEYFPDGDPIIIGERIPYSVIFRLEFHDEGMSTMDNETFEKTFQCLSLLKFEDGEKVYSRGNYEEYIKLKKLKEEKLGKSLPLSYNKVTDKLEKDLEYYQFVDEIKGLSEKITLAKPRLEVCCCKDSKTFKEFYDISTSTQSIAKCTIL